MIHQLTVRRATSTIVTMFFSLLVFTQFSSSEPQTKSKRQFPAKLEIVEVILAEGRCEMVVDLTPEDDVQIYADPEAKTPVADFSIRGTDGIPVTAEAVYRKSNISNDENQSSGYVGTLRYTVKFTVPPKDVGLKLYCKLAGWNQRRSYCLGFGRINVDIPLKR